MSVDPPHDPGGGDTPGLTQSYSKMVQNKPSPPQMLKCLKISLFKHDEDDNYNLTGDELARLLLDNFKIPHNLIEGVDTSYYRRLKVWMKPQSDIEKYKTTKAFWIRDGLRTQPNKRVSHECWLRCFRTPLEMRDEEIAKYLAPFGKVLKMENRCIISDSTTKNEKFKELLSHVKSGDRNILFKLESHIPSFVMMGNKKVKISYRNQFKSCARCCMNIDNCPGKADPKSCQEKGGPKVELRKVWDKLIENLEKIHEGEPEECDYVELSGFPIDYTEEEVDGFLKSNGVKFIQNPDDEIEKGEYPGTFIIHDPTVTDIKDLV